MASPSFIILGTFFVVSYFVSDAFYAGLLTVCLLPLGGISTWMNLRSTEDSIEFHMKMWGYKEKALRSFRLYLIFGAIYSWMSECDHKIVVKFFTEAQYNSLNDKGRDAYFRMNQDLAKTLNDCLKETGWQRYKAMEYFFFVELQE